MMLRVGSSVFITYISFRKMDEIMKTRKFQTALLRGSRAARQMRELKNRIA